MAGVGAAGGVPGGGQHLGWQSGTHTNITCHSTYLEKLTKPVKCTENTR